MIPKKIHYCWFGMGHMPKIALKCIASWKKYLPDYELKKWDENNFDIDMYPYVREAYDKRKFAFVTDVVRLYALYHEGGIYMDTDVEVLRPLDKFLNHVAFSGFESDINIPTGIMASEKGGKWVKDNLQYYKEKHFVREDESLDLTTNVEIITNYMLLLGLRQDNTYQDFPGLITFYPKDYFCPKSLVDEKLYLTKNSYTIHHFSGTWIPKYRRVIRAFVLKLGGVRLKNVVQYFFERYH